MGHNFGGTNLKCAVRSTAEQVTMLESAGRVGRLLAAGLVLLQQ